MSIKSFKGLKEKMININKSETINDERLNLLGAACMLIHSPRC